MLAWPVIQREIRLAAKKSGTYRVRVIAGGLALIFLAFAAASQLGHPQQSGRQLFQLLDNCVLAAVLLLGPVLSCDSLSRETREGTLGLLFLTPLTASQIVLSKFFVLLLNLLTVWAISLPFLMIPLLMGGIAWMDIGISFAVQLSIGVLSLAAGMYASSRSKKWLASLALAETLAVAAAYLVFAFSLSTLAFFSGRTNSIYLLVHELIELLRNRADLFKRVLIEVLNHGREFSGCLATICSFILLAFLLPELFLQRASRQIARFAEQEFETERERLFSGLFLKPRFWKRRFRQTMRRNLDRNPLAWLEYRSAWSRTFRWILVLAVTTIDSLMIAGNQWPNYLDSQIYLCCGFLLIMAFTASISFQKERETGAFELLLVAPLRITELIRGRLSAVWDYYRPVLVALIALGIVPALLGLAEARFEEDNARYGLICVSFACSYLSIPIAGLMFAMKIRNFFTVLTLTLLSALIIPALLVDFFRAAHVLFVDNSPGSAFLRHFLSPSSAQYANMIIAWHVGVCSLALLILHSSLLQRKIVSSR